MFLGGKPQLPQEQWGTELHPFNEQFGINPAYESWDVVESVAARLGVNLWHGEDTVHLWLDENNNGSFDNSSGGIAMAMQFLQQVA